jgi:solute carrier family 50 protein (sugar transporter)
MWTSPLIAVLQARKSKSLGCLNPVPFALVLFNCIGWTIFSIMKQDYFIFFSNMSGIILGTFFCVSALQLLSHPDATPKEQLTRAYVEVMMIGGISIWLVVVLFCFLVYGEKQLAVTTNVVGALSDLAAVLYFAAPMSTMAEVVSKRDASSLYFPTICINTINSLMWVLYGTIGIPDLNVAVPNGIGLLLCSSQMVLIFVYGQTKVTAPKDSQKLKEDSHAASDEDCQMSTL